MAGDFDVAARLAVGRPSVERVEIFVGACHQLGYQHPDLTAHPGQVRDSYAHEDGLDLRVLDADHAALAAAAAAADAALGRHAELMADLALAWSGRGAGAAREFLAQQGRSAGVVRDALRRAADAVARLRDDLWRSVDAKVDAVLAIDDRRLAQRAEWQAAAQTVTTGAGDRAAASELVDQQVEPFVDNDIRTDWLAAMQRTVAAITAAYDAAIVRLDTGAAATFDVPGELGPNGPAPETPLAAPDGPTIATPPAAAAPPSQAPVSQRPPSVSMVDPIPMPATTPAAAPLAAAPVDPMPAAPPPPMSPPSPMPSLGELGGGATGLGTSGFGQQLADLIGGLVGSPQGALPDPPEVDPPDDVDRELPVEEDDEPEDAESVDAADGSATDAADEEPDASDEAEPETEPEPPPAETPVPVPPEPAPPIPAAVPEDLAEEPTPCEIAADELPHVGE